MFSTALPYAGLYFMKFEDGDRSELLNKVAKIKENNDITAS